MRQAELVYTRRLFFFLARRAFPADGIKLLSASVCSHWLGRHEEPGKTQTNKAAHAEMIVSYVQPMDHAVADRKTHM